REKMAFYQQQLALCRKAEQAVRDLDFMLNQPAAEVPGLLGMRVRYLLKEQKLAAAAESAAKMKELAGDEPVQLYNAACAQALCAGAAQEAKGPDAARLSQKCADEAMNLLKHAVAKGYHNVAKMKQDQDLSPLRPRDDFKMMLSELESAKLHNK